MNDPIDWTDKPPSVPLARIWTPPDLDSWVVLLGRWSGVWIHWIGRRSVPCLGPQCPSNRHLKPAHWAGYAPAAVAQLATDGTRKVQGWTAIVLPISAELAAELEPQLVPFPGPLLHIHRSAGKRVWAVKSVKSTPKGEHFPAAFDPRPSLYRLWGIRPPEPDQAGDQADEQAEPEFHGRNGFHR